MSIPYIKLKSSNKLENLLHYTLEPRLYQLYNSNMIIEKKIWSEYFEDVASGNKNFELRLADWEINIGDTLVLKEWDHNKKEYTGREIRRAVTYVIKTKDVEKLGMWPKDDIDKYGFQIIGFRP